MSLFSDKLETEIRIVIPANIISRYTEVHRRYHDLNHINYMLSAMPIVAKSVDLSEEETEDLTWAILYHDYIYYIPDKDRLNEQKSAESFAFEHADYPRRNVVEQAILSTQTHILDENADNVTKCLVDLDLWHLGDPSKYVKGSRNIKVEYCVSDEEWAKGRGAWLEKFLERDKIYYTPAGEAREFEARYNLGSELATLKGYEDIPLYTKKRDD